MRQGWDSNPYSIHDLTACRTHPPPHTCTHSVYKTVIGDERKLNIPSLRHRLCFSYKAKTKRKATKQDTHYPFCLTMYVDVQPTGLAFSSSRPGSLWACGWVCFMAGPKTADISASKNKSDCGVKKEGGQEAVLPVSWGGHHVWQATSRPFKYCTNVGPTRPWEASPAASSARCALGKLHFQQLRSAI